MACKTGEFSPTLTIVKTRGSTHDRGTHPIVIAEGGLRVGTPTGEPAARR